MITSLINQIIQEYEDEVFFDFIPTISEKELAIQKVLVAVAILDTESALSLTY